MRLWGQAGLVSSQVAGADGEEATGGAGRVAQWWRQACALPSSQPGYELVPKELTSVDTTWVSIKGTSTELGPSVHSFQQEPIHNISVGNI